MTSEKEDCDGEPLRVEGQWDVLQHERGLDKVLAEEFRVDWDPDYDGKDGSKRVDFFCAYAYLARRLEEGSNMPVEFGFLAN